MEEQEPEVEEEEEEEEEVPLKPQLIPQGSGGSGVLMGPDTQKGLKKHTHLGLHIHKQTVPCSSEVWTHVPPWLGPKSDLSPRFDDFRLNLTISKKTSPWNLSPMTCHSP